MSAGAIHVFCMIVQILPGAATMRRLCFGHQIDTTRMPGVAARDAFHSQPATAQNTMLLNSQTGIVGTAGVKTAVAAGQRRDKQGIKTEQTFYDCL